MPSNNARPTACHELIESRLEQIRNLARAMLRAGNCTDPVGHAGEVVNEVYVKVQEAWETLRSPEDALNTVTANTARTHAHKCRREQPRPIDDAAIPWFFSGAVDPTGIYEEAILIQELLEQLEVEDQLLFSLLFQGWTYSEISVFLDTPSNTLRSRYSRAVAKLQKTNGSQVNDLAQTPIVTTSD